MSVHLHARWLRVEGQGPAGCYRAKAERTDRFMWGYWTDIRFASDFVPGVISFTDFRGRTLVHISKDFGLKKHQRNLYSSREKIINRCCISATSLCYQWTFFINGVDAGMESTFSQFTGVQNGGTWAYARRLLFTGTLTGWRNRLAGTSWSFSKGACEALHLVWSNPIQH